MFNSELMDADVAIEIIAEMIGKTLFALEKEKDEKVIKELEKKRELYTKQRDEVYSGNKETIKLVIEVYGNQLKMERHNKNR